MSTGLISGWFWPLHRTFYSPKNRYSQITDQTNLSITPATKTQTVLQFLYVLPNPYYKGWNQRSVSTGPIHLRTYVWHCNMLLRYCDIAMPFLTQNFRDFPRAMSFVPELCPRSHNTSNTYVLTCHTYVLASTHHGILQLIIGLTQTSVSFN
jgi:hypothetical protein